MDCMLLCCAVLQDISAGQVLVRVPLRLAITDVMEEEAQQRVVGQVGHGKLLTTMQLLQAINYTGRATAHAEGHASQQRRHITVLVLDARPHFKA